VQQVRRKYETFFCQPTYDFWNNWNNFNREHAETSMKGTGRKEKRNRKTVRLDVPDIRILLPKGSWYWTICFLTGCGKP